MSTINKWKHIFDSLYIIDQEYVLSNISNFHEIVGSDTFYIFILNTKDTIKLFEITGLE